MIQSSKSRILVIEDDEGTLLLLEATLSDDYEVKLARNGQEALVVLEQWKPDMLICDISMPVMDGFIFRDKIREQPLYELVPFVFLTAKTDLDDKLTGLSLGANDYITKPFEPMELKARVRGTLEKHELFRQIAYYDALTGLLNRREMNNFLAHEMERFRRYKRVFSIILFDLDHFKSINDRFGHSVGDEVLQSVAKVLDESKRTSDSACRWGGEEFLLLCPETDKKDCSHLAKRIQESIEQMTFSNEEVRVTISGGIAAMPEDGDDVEQLVNSADRALYQAKEGGRNRIVSTQSLVALEPAEAPTEKKSSSR